MEIDAIIEMFKTFEDNHRVINIAYIGDDRVLMKLL